MTLVDTRSRPTAYPSVVIKELANIVFPHRITGEIKARTRPVTKPATAMPTFAMQRTQCRSRGYPPGRSSGRIHSKPTADVPNHLRINALWDQMTLKRAGE